jgi:hypothetical protein
MVSGNSGGGCVKRHTNLKNTSNAIVSPIDLCKAKNQLLSSLPLGKSTIYQPRPNKVISSTAISQCKIIAVLLYLSRFVVIQIYPAKVTLFQTIKKPSTFWQLSDIG